MLAEVYACSHSTLHREHTSDKEIGSEGEGARRRSVFPSLLLAETPEHSSAPRPRFFPSTGQPRFQDCVLVSVGCGTQRTAHTYREDHLQVIEHLDLLREAPAAPSHQVVLTVGRGVAGSPLLSGSQQSFKIPTEPLLWARHHAGCWGHGSV